MIWSDSRRGYLSRIEYTKCSFHQFDDDHGGNIIPALPSNVNNLRDNDYLEGRNPGKKKLGLFSEYQRASKKKKYIYR